MNAVAIIIARGGSRRLPRKNVLPFCGKPLVEWSIIQARCSRCVTEDDIYLSTDDDEIAEIGVRNHIHVIRRPDWPDADQRSAMPVYIHAINTVTARRKVTHIYSLLPTQVVRAPGDFSRITEAYWRCKQTEPRCEEVIMLTPCRETSLYRKEAARACPIIFDKGFGYLGPGPSVEIKELGWWRRWGDALYHDGEEQTTRKGRRFMYRPVYWMPGQWWQAFDIDDQDSFELCETLFERYILQGRGDAVYWDYRRGGTDERVERSECEATR